MKPRSKRFAWILLGLVGLSAATALVLNAFQSNLVFFFTPTQIANKEAPIGHAFRVGGLVEQGSLHRHGTEVSFVVSDTVKSIPVTYVGILPDLFKEGKGVVAEGQLDDQGLFHAKQVLAKHDENYMPPEAAEALKQAGAMNSKISKSIVTESGSK